MKRIEVAQPGGPEQMALVERPAPEIGPGEVLIRVAAAGVNRPDLQQRKGLYPPPPGATPILGLDVAGVVERVAPDVTWPTVGSAVCALANGGGYAEYCAVPALQCLPIPKGFGFVEAASLPEVFFTAWNNVFWLGRLAEGESLLVQGGTSGVGMAAIQLAKLLRRSPVYATAGSAEKCRVCLNIGADAAINYKTEDWVARVRELTQGRGVDVVLDGQAGPYTEMQLSLLASDGRVVLLASHLGATAEVNVRNIVRRRLTLTGSTLRPRPPDYKGRIARELIEQVWPLLEQGRVRTSIHATYPLDAVASAHAIMEAGEQIGKVVLIVAKDLVDAGV
jgi:putative PIG3 family NAD(P)H quinone oxidoreductase